MTVPGLLQLRLFATRHRRAMLVGLLAVALVATVGAGWAYAKPGETTATDRRHPQTVAGTVETSAVVTGDSSVFDRGETLTDRRVYLLEATPNLTLTGRVDAPAGATVRQRLLVQYRVTRDDRVVWTDSRVLAAGTEPRVGTTVNVSRVRARARRIQEAFGAAATVGMGLRYVVDYETDRYEGRLNATVPLTFTDRAYVVDGDLAAEETRTTPVTVTRQRSPDYATVGLLAGVALLASAGAAVLLGRDDLPGLAADGEALQHQRYAEWVSRGRLPVFAADQHVEMDSLADLVNLAIDSNERVVYDAEQNSYGLLKEGGCLFWYTPGGEGLPAFSMTWNEPGEATVPVDHGGSSVPEAVDEPVVTPDGDRDEAGRQSRQ